MSERPQICKNCGNCRPESTLEKRVVYRCLFTKKRVSGQMAGCFFYEERQVAPVYQRKLLGGEDDGA